MADIHQAAARWVSEKFLALVRNFCSEYPEDIRARPLFIANPIKDRSNFSRSSSAELPFPQLLSLPTSFFPAKELLMS